MAQLFKNNAFSTLGATLSNVATSMTVATGHGDRFPIVTAPDFCMLTLQDASNNIEIIKVTARTSGADSMTIQRAQEGTTARSWAIGDVVELRITASALNPLALFEGDGTAAGIRSKIGAVGLTGDETVAGNKNFSGAMTIGGASLTLSAAGARITGDFSNATVANRLAFQTSTVNGNTSIPVIPNGTAATALHVYYETTDPANSSNLQVGTVGSEQTIRAAVTGTGTARPLTFYTNGAERLRIDTSGNVGVGVTPFARLDVSGNQACNIVAVSALDIDCSAGNYFTKTINGASTFTFSNVPASRAFAFTLELTHTSGAVTWPASVQWPGGSAPSLTTGKTHLFTFVTDDGGSRWRGAAQVNYTN